MSGRTGSRVLLGAAVVVALLAVVLRLDADIEVLLWCAPALLLLAPLVVGIFPGERALTVCRERRAAPSRRRATRAIPLRRAPLVARARRLLLALRLAERGPPRLRLAL